MKRAWEIAKAGAKKFGGKAIEYISEALKLAWKEVKKINNVENRIKDVIKKSSSRDWKNYGKHRLYIDVFISLVEMKEIRGNRFGVKRSIEAKYYYDWKTEKLYKQHFRAKELSKADDEMVAYMENEIKRMINAEIQSKRENF